MTAPGHEYSVQPKLLLVLKVLETVVPMLDSERGIIDPKNDLYAQRLVSQK